MNDKKAKKLRFVAEEMAKGMKQRLWLKHEKTGQVINHPQSVRGVYRQLKKVYRNGTNPHGTQVPASG